LPIIGAVAFGAAGAVTVNIVTPGAISDGSLFVVVNAGKSAGSAPVVIDTCFDSPASFAAATHASYVELARRPTTGTACTVVGARSGVALHAPPGPSTWSVITAGVEVVNRSSKLNTLSGFRTSRSASTVT